MSISICPTPLVMLMSFQDAPSIIEYVECQRRRHNLEPLSSKLTHTECADLYSRNFIAANKEPSEIILRPDLFNMFLLHTVAAMKMSTLMDPQRLGKTAEITGQLLQDVLGKIEKEFGQGYAKKNPHIVGNLLQVSRTVYSSVQDK